MDEEQPVDVQTPHLLVHGSDPDQHHVVATSLAEAIAYAEYLANEQGDDTARIFEMRELSMSFSPYYQVHITGAQPPPPPQEPHRWGPGEHHPKVVAISA